MKFGQIIEYKMRNIFLEKSNTKCGGEASPSPFLSIVEHISESIVWNVIKFVFNVSLSRVLPNILKLSFWPLAFILYKSSFFLKKKGVLELVSLSH